MAPIAYLVSRFPSVSQTFILNEIKQLEVLGWDVHLMPMIEGKDSVTHPGAQELTSHATFLKVLSTRCLRANLYWAVKRPLRYVKAITSTVTLPGRNVRFYPRALWCILWSMMVATEIEKRRLKHVHAHWATFPAHAALVASWLTGCSYSFTAHAHDIYANSYGMKQKIEQARFVVTISDYNRRYLSEQVSGGRFKVIRCGVDLNALTVRHRGSQNCGKLRVLAVGSLEEKKGHKYLVEACARLVARGRSVDCRIVGEGPLRSTLENLIAVNGLDDVVVLLGSLSSDEVAAELRVADVFVMPSIVATNGMMEGIPVALMEAMAAGVPVVASNISGIPELVSDGVSGILIDEKDAAGISNSIETLMDDKELVQALVTAARASVVEKYDLIRNVGALSDSFAQALSSGD